MENKLPEEFKKKRVAALRSGEYKQGASKLHNTLTDTYCCLGVACRVAEVDIKTCEFGQYISHELIPVPGSLRGANEITKLLAEMNDGENRNKHSFSEIADYIEANL